MLSVQMEQGKRLDQQASAIGTTMLFVIKLTDKMQAHGIETPPLPEEFKNLAME